MTQDVNFYDKPLSDEEFVEIGELLALMPEPYESMEPDRMDGFLTAIALLPEPVAPSEWMPFVFDEEGRSDAALTDSNKQHDLEDLVYRRMRNIERTLAACDPIGGWEAIAALEPFAAGFLEAINRWEGLKDTNDEMIDSALLGILRHLPANLLGDLAQIKEDLDFESPLENIKDALEDVAESVAEIAAVTRGFTSKTKPSKVKGGQRSGRRSNHVISKDQKRFRRG